MPSICEHGDICKYGSRDARCCIPPKLGKSFGISPYTGIAEDVDMPIIRTGNTSIEDVSGQD